MDYSLPVAQRTRSREARLFKDIHTKMRKLRNGSSSSGVKERKESRFAPRGSSSKKPLFIDGDEEEEVEDEEKGFSDAKRRGKRERSFLSSNGGSETKSPKVTKQRKSQKSFSVKKKAEKCNGYEEEEDWKKSATKRQPRSRRNYVSSSSEDEGPDRFREKVEKMKNEKRKRKRSKLSWSSDGFSILDSSDEVSPGSSNGRKRNVAEKMKKKRSDHSAEKAMMKKESLWDKDTGKEKKKDTAFVRKRNRQRDDFRGEEKKKTDKDSQEEENRKKKPIVKNSGEARKKKSIPIVDVSKESSSESDGSESDHDDDEEHKEEMVKKKNMVKDSEEEDNRKKRKKKPNAESLEEEKNKKKKNKPRVVVSESSSETDDTDSDDDDDDEEHKEEMVMKKKNMVKDSGEEEEYRNKGKKKSKAESLDEEMKNNKPLVIVSESSSETDDTDSDGDHNDDCDDNNDDDGSPAKETSRGSSNNSTLETEKAAMEDEKQAEEEKKKKNELRKKKASGFSAYKILINSMTSSGDKNFTKGLAPAEDEKKEEDVPELPQKFSFRPRSEPLAESETDQLWRECAVSMESKNVTSSATDVKAEEDQCLDFEMRCALGQHEEELDDELGIVCSYCGQVIVGIKDVVSPFGKGPEVRSVYRDFEDRKRSSSAFLAEFEGEDSSKEPWAYAETVWDLIPGVKHTMFPHQREALEFVWRHIDAADVDSRGGGGCIVSHAPGTGKSRLAISLIQAFLRLRPDTARPVIVAPCGVLLSWEDEFRKWHFGAPFHNLNSKVLTGREDEVATTIATRKRRRCGPEDVQAAKLYSWWKGGGVLGVSYGLLEKLAGESAEWDGDREREVVRRILLDSPGLIVLDEGHIPRNDDSLIWQVVSRVKTRRRVVLSGTPFQNNFEELFNTMQVARPGIALRRDWRGLSRDPAKIKRIIDPFVHVHRGDILHRRLLGISESVVFLRPTPIQLSLARRVPQSKRDPMRKERAESLIAVHPSLALGLGVAGFPGKAESAMLKARRARHEEGVKTRFAVELIRMCSAAGERVLVFSQYLEPLSLVAVQLRAEFGWAQESEILCIEGKRCARERQVAINKFNSADGPARVMLVSTRAGGEGISLVGASRVVMLDTVWNPSVERQATRRAYRLGQTRFVYVYHLVAAGTVEEDKYRRQLAKSKLSDLVFSPSAAGNGDGLLTEDAVLDQMLCHEELKDIFVKITGKQDSATDL